MHACLSTKEWDVWDLAVPNKDRSLPGLALALSFSSQQIYQHPPQLQTSFSLFVFEQVAYNSLFLGEFAQPDWDMFQVGCSAALLKPSYFRHLACLQSV